MDYVDQGQGQTSLRQPLRFGNSWFALWNHQVTSTWDVSEHVVGGEDEDRTHDLRIANAALSQLSYPPTVREV